MIQKVVLIGAGNLATSLAFAIHNAGISIMQVYSRTIEGAKAIAQKVNAEPIDTLERLHLNANIYIIALPDDIILQAVKSLPRLNGIVVHTSGSTSISVFKGAKVDGYGVFYPLQTFSRNRIVPFKNIPICIEANSDGTSDTLKQLSIALSGIAVHMDSEQRRWLHLSGVFASNFTNHMLAQAYSLTTEHRISFDVVKPLVEETVRKAFEGNPALFQTGPAIRNDKQTMEQHMQMLDAFGLSDLYKELSLSIQNLAKGKKD